MDQNSSHIAEMTVRETLDFAARVQGGGHGALFLAKLAYCLHAPDVGRCVYGLLSHHKLPDHIAVMCALSVTYSWGSSRKLFNCIA